jgi:hypothetical protein
LVTAVLRDRLQALVPLRQVDQAGLEVGSHAGRVLLAERCCRGQLGLQPAERRSCIRVGRVDPALELVLRGGTDRAEHRLEKGVPAGGRRAGVCDALLRARGQQLPGRRQLPGADVPIGLL